MQIQEQKEPVGGKRKLDLIAVYVKPEVKARLEIWAEKKERSVSWLVSKLVDEALEQDRDRNADEGKL